MSTNFLDSFALNGTEYNFLDKVAQSRLDQLVGGANTPSEGNSELLDIRVGANGKSYDSAGAAIRGQFQDIQSDRNVLDTNSNGILEALIRLLPNFLEKYPYLNRSDNGSGMGMKPDIDGQGYIMNGTAKLVNPYLNLVTHSEEQPTFKAGKWLFVNCMVGTGDPSTLPEWWYPNPVCDLEASVSDDAPPRIWYVVDIPYDFTPTRVRISHVKKGKSYVDYKIKPYIFYLGDTSESKLQIDSDKTYKICAFNVGNFSYGQAGNGQGTDEMFNQFLDTFHKCNADIYMFSEWDKYWNFEEETLSSDKLKNLSPYWSGWEDGTPGRYVYQKVSSAYKLRKVTSKYFADGESRHFVDCVINLSGKPVHFICTHLPWSTKQLRDSDIDKIIEYIKTNNIEYFVVGGDFNQGLSTDGADAPTNAEEMAEMVKSDIRKWTVEGYNSAQGGFYGVLNTSENTTETFPMKPYDNIVTSPNIFIRDVRTVDTEASDHKPLVVEIQIL